MSVQTPAGTAQFVFPENILASFHSAGQRRLIGKKKFFAEEGQILDKCALIVRGAFKLTYGKGKKQWIKSFVFERDLIGSIPGILQEKPSTYSVEALEDAEILTLPASALLRDFSGGADALRLLNRILAALYLKKEERIRDFLLLKPEERYRKFISEYGAQLPRISQNDQAAYLGITAVALSRIKARVFAPSPKAPAGRAR